MDTMEEISFTEITEQAALAAETLFAARSPRGGELMVLGCSTSETVGKRIGSSSSSDAARAILDGILPVIGKAGVILAVQGCEHINRCLCMEREDAERLGLEIVNVRPHAHAGGACITAYYALLRDPVMVEGLHDRAVYGMDIGDTLIGMHMKSVVVPVHSTLRHVGSANLVLAYSRPKYVGGPRAQYDSDRA